MLICTTIARYLRTRQEKGRRVDERHRRVEKGWSLNGFFLPLKICFPSAIKKASSTKQNFVSTFSFGVHTRGLLFLYGSHAIVSRGSLGSSAGSQAQKYDCMIPGYLGLLPGSL
jgi:hypothetical protein